MGAPILIVEDEERIAKLHMDYLGQSGFPTHSIGTGIGVVEWVRANQPALIILDLMLPGKDGIEIIKELRGFTSVPVIMVTARVEEIDRLLGLELGADDYICKPFSPREVVARVKSVLRRTAIEAEKHELAPQSLLSLNEERQSALVSGHPLDLTAVEFRLLSILASRPGRIYSRNQLMDLIYQDQRIVCDRTIDSHIKKLRKKITAIMPDLEVIHSIYGVGYKYEIPV